MNPIDTASLNVLFSRACQSLNTGDFTALHKELRSTMLPCAVEDAESSIALFHAMHSPGFPLLSTSLILCCVDLCLLTFHLLG